MFSHISDPFGCPTEQFATLPFKNNDAYVQRREHMQELFNLQLLYVC